MAVVAGAIAGAIGVGGAVGTAVVEIGAAVGLSYLAKAITPKPKTSSTRGQSLNLQIATNPTRKVPIGQVGNAGDLTYWQLSGSNNDVLHMVIALGDVECNALVTSAIFVDGVKQTIDSDGFVSGYTGSAGVKKLKVTFHNGDPGQAVDSAVSSASGGRWTSNEVGKYVCYAVVEATYSENAFQSGIPQIVFVMQGAKLYDWRLDSTNGGSGSQRWDDHFKVSLGRL